MKRLVCAALALSLIGSTAASADRYDHGNRSGGYSQQDHGDYRRGDNGAGLAIGLGVGLFALAVAASQQRDHNYDSYDNRGYGYGGDTYYSQGGYNQGAYGYGNGYGSYDRHSYGSYRHDGYRDHSRGDYGSTRYNGYGGW